MVFVESNMNNLFCRMHSYWCFHVFLLKIKPSAQFSMRTNSDKEEWWGIGVPTHTHNDYETAHTYTHKQSALHTMCWETYPLFFIPVCSSSICLYTFQWPTPWLSIWPQALLLIESLNTSPCLSFHVSMWTHWLQMVAHVYHTLCWHMYLTVCLKLQFATFSDFF